MEPNESDSLVEENLKLKRLIDDLLKRLPPTGFGRWRQGVENPRSIYVHQGDDPIGRPVGQMYSPDLAEMVCEAVNAHMAEFDPHKKDGNVDGKE